MSVNRLKLAEEQNSMLIALTAASGLQWNGLDLAHLMPPGTNLQEFVQTGLKKQNTASVLAFHLKRAMLQAAHGMISRYAEMPHAPFNIVGRVTNRLFGIQPSPDRYPHREATLDEIQAFTTNGPRHVGVALEMIPPPPQPTLEEPKAYKLLTGEICRPTQEELDEYRRETDRNAENLRMYWDNEAIRLSRQVADLVVWAVLSRSVKVLTIYEREGVLRKYTTILHQIIENELSFLSEAQQRTSSIRFHDSSPSVDSSQLAIVLSHSTDETAKPRHMFGESVEARAVANQKLIGTKTTPDLFVAFDSSTGGYPLYSLRDTIVFAPHRRDLITSKKLFLVDWINALRFYQYVHSQELARLSADGPPVELPDPVEPVDKSQTSSVGSSSLDQPIKPKLQTKVESDTTPTTTTSPRLPVRKMKVIKPVTNEMPAPTLSPNSIAVSTSAPVPALVPVLVPDAVPNVECDIDTVDVAPIVVSSAAPPAATAEEPIHVPTSKPTPPSNPSVPDAVTSVVPSATPVGPAVRLREINPSDLLKKPTVE